MSKKINFWSANVDEMVPLHRPFFGFRRLAYLGIVAGVSTLGGSSIYHISKSSKEHVVNSIATPASSENIRRSKEITPDSTKELTKKEQISQESGLVSQEWNQKCVKANEKHHNIQTCENLQTKQNSLQKEFAESVQLNNSSSINN